MPETSSKPSRSKSSSKAKWGVSSSSIPRIEERIDARLRSIADEESGAIASKFDPATGRWGLYNGEQPLFEVDVATGELRVNGRPVQVTYKD